MRDFKPAALCASMTDCQRFARLDSQLQPPVTRYHTEPGQRRGQASNMPRERCIHPSMVEVGSDYTICLLRAEEATLQALQSHIDKALRQPLERRLKEVEGRTAAWIRSEAKRILGTPRRHAA